MLFYLKVTQTHTHTQILGKFPYLFILSFK